MSDPTPTSRDRFRVLCQRVAHLTDADRAALAARMPITTCEGRVLSPHNQCLIALQTDAPVTIVGGFRQWLKQGRCVKKGEHGLMIWFPRDRPKASASEEDESEVRFMMGYVFDISQTQDVETVRRAS